MNIDTKRHIDSARQVLVGVVPNPTSQIDQITNALIYKFMDDMDQASIKQGGEPAFFVDDLEIYAWTRLMDPRMGNQERMNLYGEALINFSQAKQLPELFRGIFKSAFLPYRSPETLGLFLKEIDYFDYSHPEELGNAYEYLLSIMSSQGDAGQFRTPRHIIDFIVDVVNPTKDDKILDPACGTGGFLVSSYKHILAQHDAKDGSKEKEKPLTPDERKKLMANFEGYDIDPTMVRIAQVNMYLHQFKNPKIFQYDSLSSEERWNDKFDVILANPPFMSPKGGIKPHSKFSIPSSRSEVLFVDYIINHLRPKGRAGIIVPEGIIFQSGTAHKQLRKNLVKDGLYAVVSLPSGVFAPYSGVKTSILLFNNELAKTSQEILFVKIESDGFDLGAQRRASVKNDLPMAFEVLNKWNTGEKVENKLVVYVDKSKIAANGDYNLSVDRYRAVIDFTTTKWPMIELKDICVLEYGKPLKEEVRKGGEYPVFGSNGIVGYHNEYLVEAPFIIIGRKGTAGAVVYSQKNGFPIDTTFYVKLFDKNKVDTKFLYYVLGELGLNKLNTQAGVPGLNRNDAYKLKIPLPPLEIQKQIVAELDGYAGIIAGAKQIAKHWKPKIDIDPKWEKVKLGEVCNVLTDYTANGSFASLKENVQYKNQKDYALLVRLTDLRKKLENEERKYVTEHSYKFLKKSSLFGGEYLIANVGANIGDVYLMPKIEQPATLGPNMYLVKFNEKVISSFIFIISESIIKPQVIKASISAAQPKINKDEFRKIEIPLPPLTMQKQIVGKIETERTLVESAKKLIDIYEQKTKKAIAKLWQ